ncbi:MAG: hypothetical protein ACK2TZ_08715, partial [Anaerolineales bacterium]
MPSRIRIRTIIAGVILLAGFLVWAGTAGASPNPIPDPLPTWRSAPPPTVYPPSQSDNGAQLYWGMCQDCHGDQEQGLTAEWRSAFAPDYQDCWEAGCHGEDRAPNSFLIPATGAPALAGPGALPGLCLSRSPADELLCSHGPSTGHPGRPPGPGGPAYFGRISGRPPG